MIQPVNALSPKVFFKGEAKGAKKPANLRVEKNIALINSAGISTLIGIFMTAISRNYTNSWSRAGLMGIGFSALSMTFIAPRLLYKAGINTSKKSEMDVFLKDTKKSGLTSKIESYSKNLVKKSA